MENNWSWCQLVSRKFDERTNGFHPIAIEVWISTIPLPAINLFSMIFGFHRPTVLLKNEPVTIQRDFTATNRISHYSIEVAIGIITAWFVGQDGAPRVLLTFTQTALTILAHGFCEYPFDKISIHEHLQI